MYSCIVSQLRTNENNNIFKELCKVTIPCIDQGDQTLDSLHSRLGASPKRYIRAYGFLATTDNLRTYKFTPKLNQGVEAREQLPSIHTRHLEQ